MQANMSQHTAGRGVRPPRQVSLSRQRCFQQRPTRSQTQLAATQNNSKQPEQQQQQQQQSSRSTRLKPPQAPPRRSTPDQSPWAQQLQARWDSLDTPQKGYTVVVGLLALFALPRILTLGVLGVERVLIGGLLALEEVLLEVLFRGGAVLGLVAVLALGVYLFVIPKKTTK